MNIKVFPALNGDCILIEVSNKIVLVDGGYVNTYKEFLFSALKNYASKGFSISHIIVSHIDADHISGVIKLLENNLKDKVIKIEHIWHNAFRHIQQHVNKNSKYELKNGHYLSSFKVGSYNKEDSYSEKNISAEQGSMLGALILKGNYKWNYEFGNKAVSTDNFETIKITPEITIRLLSPNNTKLGNLHSYWKKELFKMGFLESTESIEFIDDAFEFLISQEKEKKILKEKDISSSQIDIEELAKKSYPEDTSVSNGSSISFVLEYQDLKLLFLADSHPSQIVNSLKRQYKKEHFPIKFDLIKISHHGSIANTSNELLQLIDSERFVFSTNGTTFNHPDIETIARVVSRNVNFKRILYFNYPLEILQILKDSQQDKYNFECFVSDGKTPIEIKF